MSKKEARIAESLKYSAALLRDATCDVLEAFEVTGNDDLAPLVNWLTDEITPRVESASEIVNSTDEYPHLLSFEVIEHIAHARRDLASVPVPHPLERGALVSKLSRALNLLDDTLAAWGFFATEQIPEAVA